MTGTDDETRAKRAAKAREVQLRRMAERQRLELRKSRTRDPNAPDFGVYWLDRITTQRNRRTVTPRAGVTLDEIEKYLTGKGETS